MHNCGQMGQKWCIVYMNEKAHTNAQMWVNGTGGELISGYSQLHNCNIWRCYCAANVLFSAETQLQRNINMTTECLQRTTVITGPGLTALV